MVNKDQLRKQITNPRLVNSLDMIRQAAEDIWGPDTPRIIHGYTGHGIPHSERVAGFVARLLDANSGQDLSPEEMYLLLAGVYLHDIGMQCDVVRFPEIKARAERLGAQFTVIFTAQAASEYNIDEQKAIRENHQYLTAAWIDYAHRENKTVLGPAIKTIPPGFEYLVDDLMDVCKYHAKLPISDCPSPRFGQQVRKQLIAALLRFADELDIDRNRVSIETVKNFSLDPRNSVYWWLHNRALISFSSSHLVTLTIRMHPDDIEQYGSFVTMFITEFQNKNQPVLSILAENNIPIIIDANSKVMEHDRVERLPPEIVQALSEMQRSVGREIKTERTRDAENHLNQDVVDLHHQRELRVRTEMNQAEQMVTEERHREAAEAFARASTLLAEARQTAEARRYAMRAAEQYLADGDRSTAARQYLRAAQVWLNDALTPELATEQLEKAHKIASDLGEPALQVEVLVTSAWAAFANLRDDDAKSFLEQANGLLPQITDESQRTGLARTLALQHATLAMVWKEWDTAQEVLNAALAACPETAKEERLDLLQGLLKISTERSDWETADTVYQEAQGLLDIVGSQRQGLVAMHYGASLARRGALPEAHSTYNIAIQLLDGHTDTYTLSLVYQNMQYMLNRNGLIFFDSKHDARLIDLFNSTQAANRGYAHELEAKNDLNAQKYRGALQHIRLALAYYWRDGALLGIENAYQTLAKLNDAMGYPEEALFAAIRASDLKAAEEYGKMLRDLGGKELLDTVVPSLVQDYPVACEQKVAVKALGVMADVIPPTLLEQTITHLVVLLKGPEGNREHTQVRRYATESLRSLVSQLTEAQTNMVVRLALDQFQRRQFWTITEELLKLLEQCFTQRPCRVASTLYRPVADVMLTFDGANHLRSSVERVVVNLAYESPPEVRAQVVAHLKNQPNQSDSLKLLVFLKEPIPEDQLETTIEGILSAINAKPVIVGQTTIFGIGGVSPREVNYFHEVLTPSLYNRVIEGLLEAIINEHNILLTRSEAILALSNLPTEVLIERADEIADYLLWGAEGTLPCSQIINWELESQTNPISNVRMNTGNIEQVRQSSLCALGYLYSYVSPEYQERINAQFIAASRQSDSTVRLGVAMAFNAIEGNVELPSRLLCMLTVLLYDSDPVTCGWACAAIGQLIVRGLAGSFEGDLFEQLIELAETAQAIDVRVGAAVGLRRLAQSKDFDTITQQRIQAILKVLSNDVSFRVRREAAVK
jgi:tetratricopeptide (TPR) repeat protein